MSSETYLNASEAAEAAGISLVTLRKHLKAGKFPNAYQVDKGKVKVWQIPLTDLHASGLLDKVQKGAKRASEAELQQQRVFDLETDYDRLTAELETTRKLLERADQELEYYRQRERYFMTQLETKEVQEQRRFRWFRGRP